VKVSVGAHNVALAEKLVYIPEVNFRRKQVAMNFHSENKHSTRELHYRQKIYASIYL